LAHSLDTSIDVCGRDSRVWYNGSGGVGDDARDLCRWLLGEAGADDSDSGENKEPVKSWDVTHESLGWNYIGISV